MESNTLKYATRASQLHSNPHFAHFMKQRRSGYEPSDTETDWQDSPLHSQIHQNGAFGPRSPIIDLDLPRNISPTKHSRRQESVPSPPLRRHNSKSPYKTRKDEGIANQRLPTPPGRTHRSKSPYKTSDGNAVKKSLPSPPGRKKSSKSTCKARRDDGRTISPLSTQRNVSPFSKPESGRQVSPYKTRRDGGRTVSPGSSQRYVSPLSRSESGRQASPYKQDMKEHNMNNDDETLNSNRKKNQRMHKREDMATNSEFAEANRGSERSNRSRRSATAPRPRAKEAEQENSHAQNEQAGERCQSPLQRGMNHKQREMEGSHTKSPSVGELNEMVANIKMLRSPMLNALNFRSTESISPGDIFFSRDHTALQMEKNGIPKDDKAVMYPKPIRFPFPHIDSVHLQRNKSNGHIDHNIKKISTSSGSKTTMTSVSAASKLSYGAHSTETSKISDASGKSTGSSKRFAANRRKSQAETWFSCMRKGPCKTSKSPERKHFDEASFIEKARVVESLKQFWADKHQPGSLNGFTCHKQEAQILSQLVSHDSIPHILLKGPSGSGKRSLALAVFSEIFGDASRNMSHDLRYFQVQIMEVLIQIAKKEDFELPMSFAVKVATKSKQNVRRAIMALEALCSYPFVDDQPIPFGWEDVLVELAAEILTDPSPKQ